MARGTSVYINVYINVDTCLSGNQLYLKSVVLLDYVSLWLNASDGQLTSIS